MQCVCVSVRIWVRRRSVPGVPICYRYADPIHSAFHSKGKIRNNLVPATELAQFLLPQFVGSLAEKANLGPQEHASNKGRNLKSIPVNWVLCDFPRSLRLFKIETDLNNISKVSFYTRENRHIFTTKVIQLRDVPIYSKNQLILASRRTVFEWNEFFNVKLAGIYMSTTAP